MDTDKDGQISFEEFYNHHLKLNGLSIWKAKHLDDQIAKDLIQVKNCKDRDRL